MTSLRTRQRLINELRSLGIQNEHVLSHMMDIPRHLFVEEALASRAYENTALPIGFGQTISQPYTVARMTELLLLGDAVQSLNSTSSVLEIGTGCGFQTLLLSNVCRHVTTVERITQLHRKARNRLYDLGVRNVTYLLDDGFVRSSSLSFDGILTTAASLDVPKALVDQLKVGGRIVMPLVTDRASKGQHLIVVDKCETGITQKIIEPASFVPRQFGID